VAAIALVALGTGTRRWWSGALAGSRSTEHSSVRISGEAADWTNTSKIVATFEDPIHCMSWLEPDRSLEVVVGRKRRVVTVDVTTNAVKPSALGAEAFAVGCPQRSARGEVLFESFDHAGRRQIMLAPSAGRTHEAKAITPGFQPVWFPSGHEFAYTADDSHAAVFSLPVMTTTIVNERAEHSGLLTGKAVAPDGRSIALRYVDQAMRWHVVVHELPTLAITSSAVFDEVAADFEFLNGKDSRLAFSLSDKSGAVFAIHDPGTNEVDRVGSVPGHILGLPTRGQSSFAVSDVLIQSDVWLIEKGDRGERLTTGGQSFRPDVSAKGDLIVEHSGIDERTSIQLRVKGQPPRFVSTGPRDYTPHFLPDGSGWLYVDGARQTIRRCDLSAHCEDVYTARDNEMPFQPVASPDLRQIAFVTAIGRERLKLLGSDGAVRDLAPARADCAPLWGPGNHVWVLQGGEKTPTWAEIEAESGEVLRTIPIGADVRQESRDCPPLSSPPEVSRPREAASWSSARSSIRIVNHQHLPLGQMP
jgi:hypothetical protein